MAVRRSGTNECQGYFSKNLRSGLLCEGLTACPVQSSPHLDRSLRQAPGTGDPHIIDDPTIPTPVPPPETKRRPTCAEDAADLAAVMAARGGTPADHAPAARRLLDRVPVLLLAERAGSHGPRVVGWPGATLAALYPGAQPRWLTAGLTVTPEARRTGVGRRLLHAVIGAVADRGGGDLHSVVNAGNAPSRALHASLGLEIVETGPRFAGIEFAGGVGVLLSRPTCPESAPACA